MQMLTRWCWCDRIQTISGTGANHIGALFLARFYGPWEGKTQAEKIIYISNPTWGKSLLLSPSQTLADVAFIFTANHKAIFANVGCTTVDYPYYDPKTIGLAFESYTAFLRAAPAQSVFLLHACAHNPTGVDPTRDQWKEVCDIFLEKGHYAFFDCA
jgi:aspartate aminotransferase